jgi:selenocysteine lyase/cysteine desulfurase
MTSVEPRVAGVREPDWERIRRDYLAGNDRAYLDTACKGVPGPGAVQAIADHCAFLRESPGASTTADTLVALEQFERARRAAATLIGADATEVALVPSTQAGLIAVADALDLQAGDVVLACDIEFVGTLLPWTALASRGVEVRFVPHRDGRVEIADLSAAIDERTRAIVVSSVQEVNGFLLDLDALAALCRDRGLVSVVDGVQQIGPSLLDVRRTPIDVLAVGGHKWLCAPFGMGFLYASGRLHARLRPTMQGYMTAEPPSGDWLEYLESPERRPDDPLRFSTGARMLELGAIGSSLAAAGLASALEELLEIGPAAIAARTAGLVQTMQAALEDAGARIVTPATPDGAPPPFLCFRTGATVDDERAAVERLAEAGVSVSLRFTTGVGGIRVSPYFYNDEADVERLATVVRTLPSRAGAPA